MFVLVLDMAIQSYLANVGGLLFLIGCLLHVNSNFFFFNNIVNEHLLTD